MNNQAMDEALDAVVEPSDPSIFTASNELRLRLKRVSQMIIADANRRLVAPKPPVTWIEEKSRNEENPNDPGYLKDMEHFRYDQAMLAMRVYYILGTEIFDLAGLEPPESQNWSDSILAADDSAEIPAEGKRRYNAWLKLYAIPDEDQVRLLNEIIRFSGSGTLELDVIAAQASFRDQSGGDSVGGIRPASEDPRRDSDAAVPGDDPRIRGEGSSGLRALPVAGLDQRVDVV